MMKNPPKSEFPFILDSKHIYNKLCNEPSSCKLDFGWGIFQLELCHNLTYNGNCCDGLTEFDIKSIKLDMELTDEDARETLMHEIIHCFLETIGLCEKNFHSETVITTNEFIAHSLAKQMMIFRNLNPGVMELIYEHSV